MSENLPSALKIPEVSRFVHRATQLRSVKPAIAYWCEYHVVNQIVGKGLHTTDDACFDFTKTLIERLETAKKERADDEAIVDNDVSHCYVKEFAQETFSRAERVLRANRVTRQTADTFDAAATFFDVTREWEAPDEETLKKIKFAKWNAARILKAIRDHTDPNESNPKFEDEELCGEDDAILDADKPELAQDTSALYQKASVQDSTGEEHLTLGPLSPPCLSPTLQGDTIHQTEPPHQTGTNPFVGNASTPLETENQVPPTKPATTEPLPEGQAGEGNHQSRLHDDPTTHGHLPPTALAASLQASPTPVTAKIDPQQIDRAQKHARWVISALNFEDVQTAMHELRNALAVLEGS